MVFDRGSWWKVFSIKHTLSRFPKWRKCTILASRRKVWDFLVMFLDGDNFVCIDFFVNMAISNEHIVHSTFILCRFLFLVLSRLRELDLSIGLQIISLLRVYYVFNIYFRSSSDNVCRMNDTRIPKMIDLEMMSLPRIINK